jgi:hypothetical protein
VDRHQTKILRSRLWRLGIGHSSEGADGADEVRDERRDVELQDLTRLPPLTPADPPPAFDPGYVDLQDLTRVT